MGIQLTDWCKLVSGEPRLIGSRCGSCGAFYFPPQLLSCRNSSCVEPHLERAALSNFGVLWSYTILYERPPPPFAGSEGFSRLPVVIVELSEERMKVMGYLASQIDPDSLSIGQRMRLVSSVVDSDGSVEYQSLQWTVSEEIHDE